MTEDELKAIGDAWGIYPSGECITTPLLTDKRRAKSDLSLLIPEVHRLRAALRFVADRSEEEDDRAHTYCHRALAGLPVEDCGVKFEWGTGEFWPACSRVRGHEGKHDGTSVDDNLD